MIRSKFPSLLYGVLFSGLVVSIGLGRRLIPQIILLAFVTFLVTGGRYEFLYIIYKTLPRDLRALCGFAKLNARLWWYEKRRYTVPQMFRNTLKRHPGKVAFWYEKKPWTFAEVDVMSNRVGHYFKSQGLSQGDTVALLMENRPEFVCVWLGLAKVGVVTALINTNLRQGPLVHCVTAAGCRAVIVSDEMAPGLQEVLGQLGGMKVYHLAEGRTGVPGAADLAEGLARAPVSPPADRGASSKDKLVYIYTSGTTGLPKAAVITHLRYMFMVTGVSTMLDVSEEDVLYTSLPLYHTAGGMIGTGQVLLTGATMVVRKKFSASNFWSDCVEHNCTVAQYIGEICRYLLSAPERPEEKRHRIRLMFGNGLRPQIWRRFVDRFRVPRIGEFYGATEGISNIVNIDNTVGAVGFVPRYATFAYPVCLVKVDDATHEPIRDKDGFCMQCGPGETGMFIGKINPNKPIASFSGYADKKASEKKILRDVFKKGDQYFNSGDVLVMDEFGYFYFKDRTGDTFRWRGENVATSEVEAVISNVVGLKDAVVYGVEIPNVEGKAGMAAILDEESSLDLGQLAAGVRQQLPTYARPLFVRVLSHLPLTGTYKLIKRDLQLEGFDITAIKDKLYYMDAKGQYSPLTRDVYEDILSNKLRL
ncbi:long-chain fatty acid transport protein 1-like [Bacillus rossius redtenbacheri]|uniref:long-chain fatty acid transport protein 1-like n=1 Tax=Bacillus rossius redtenbacheri TaxID=93214 RepID=UPI002FDDD5AF